LASILDFATLKACALTVSSGEFAIAQDFDALAAAIGQYGSRNNFSHSHPSSKRLSNSRLTGRSRWHAGIVEAALGMRAYQGI